MKNIVNDLEWRYACKKFDPNKTISKTDFEIITDALVLTASSYGLQPWEFVVVENKDKRSDLIAASYNQNQVADASHLIVLCMKKEINEELVMDYLNDISDTRSIPLEELEGLKKMLLTLTLKEDDFKRAWAKNQVYIALGNLLNVCATLRVDACPMEGVSPKKYDEILGLSKMGLKAVVVCPVGYRSKDDEYSELNKVRFSKDKIVKIIN